MKSRTDYLHMRNKYKLNVNVKTLNKNGFDYVADVTSRKALTG